MQINTQSNEYGFIAQQLFNRKEQIFIPSDLQLPKGKEKVQAEVVFGMFVNLEEYGYSIDSKTIRKLLELDEKTVTDIYNTTLEYVQHARGADVKHELLFKNFPESCKNMDEETLSNTRFISYFTQFFDIFTGSDVTQDILWDGVLTEREHDNNHKNRLLTIGDEENLKTIARNLLGGRLALSPDDKSMIIESTKIFGEKEIIPEIIQYKENQAFLAASAIKGLINYQPDFVTLEDFMRTAYALSDKVYKKDEKFPTLPNQQRKALLTALEQGTKNHPTKMIESLATSKAQHLYRHIFKNLLHIDNTKNKYLEIKNAFKKGNQIYTQLAQGEIALEETKRDPSAIVEAAEHFQKAGAGYVIRYMSKILCETRPEYLDKIQNIIKECVHETATAVLLQTRSAIKNQDNLSVAFPKGNTVKAHMFERNNIVPEKIALPIVQIITDEIQSRFKSVSLGKVYIEPNLKDCPVPYDGRNASGENRSVERGTAFPLDHDKDVLRVFCYKEDPRGGFYDLSATILDDKFNFVQHVSWTNLKLQINGTPIGVHSGDNSNCTHGCTEMIDIDKKALKDVIKSEQDLYEKESSPNEQKSDKTHSLKDARYIAFNVFAWNHIQFSNMKRVFFGTMDRNGAGNDYVSERDKQTLKDNGYHIGELNNGHPPFYYQVPSEIMDKMQDYKPEVAFDPATVEHRFDLDGNSLCKVAMIYDINDDKIYFADIDARQINESPYLKVKDRRAKESTVPREIINTNPNGPTLMVEDFYGATSQASYAIIKSAKPNLYELFTDAAIGSNSQIVDSPEKADVVFSIDRPKEETEQKYVTPFDRDVVVSEFLSIKPNEEYLREHEIVNTVKNSDDKKNIEEQIQKILQERQNQIDTFRQEIENSKETGLELMEKYKQLQKDKDGLRHDIHELIKKSNLTDKDKKDLLEKTNKAFDDKTNIKDDITR